MALIRCVGGLNLDLQAGYMIKAGESTGVALPANSTTANCPIVIVGTKGYTTLTASSGSAQTSKHYWGIKPDGSFVYGDFTGSNTSGTVDVSAFDYVIAYSASSASHTLSVSIS